MELNRAELLETLKRVSPALADDKNPLVPVLSHLCFDGKNVTAYDNIVAMRTRCKTEFTGALPGSLMLSMLNASAAERVVIEPNESGVQLRVGRAKLKMAMLSAEDFMFRKPEYTGAPSLVLDEKMVALFRTAVRSASASMEDSSKSGITLVFDKRLTLYSTDSVTLVRCKSANQVKPELAGKSFIMPERFCNLMLRIGTKELFITEQDDMVAISDNVILYGRVIQGAQPEQFESVFAKCLTEGFAEIPPLLERCLERCRLVDNKWVTLTYEPGRLGLTSTGSNGVLEDSVKFDQGSNEVTIVTRAECVMKYLDVANGIRVSSNSVMLTGDGFQVLVAVQSNKPAAQSDDTPVTDD